MSKINFHDVVMAERRPLPVSDIGPESSTSGGGGPDAKRSRVDVELEEGGGAEGSGEGITGAWGTATTTTTTTTTLTTATTTTTTTTTTDTSETRLLVEEITIAGRSLETSERLPSTESSSGDEIDNDKVRSGKLVSSHYVSTCSRTTTAHRGARSSTSGQPEGSTEGTALIGEHAHYEEISLIGDGAYGTVYKARDLTSGQVVALKKVRVPLTEDGLPTSTLREIAGLKQLERFEHPHIVRLLDVCQGTYLQLPATSDDQQLSTERIDRGLTLWLVFEHVERDLASYITSCNASGGVPSQVARRMSREILLGVDFLHSHRIVHRDLKPQNLLVTRDGRIKIADFGLAKTYDFEMRLTSVVVTLWYRAPEVLLGCPYATPVDLWSVGCILAEINRLRPLFPGTSEGDQLDKIFQIIGTPSQENWPENVSLSWTAFPQRRPKPLVSLIPGLDDHGLNLIGNLLTFDPHVRLTAAQALTHQYFASSDEF